MGRVCHTAYSYSPASYDTEVQNRIYDAMSLVRNINWEMNRLRIEIPFDLRQLLNQMNNYAASMPRGDFADSAIVAYKLHNEVKNLQKKIVPRMKEEIKKKIKEAELTEKVAADEMRKENEKTLTEKEREQREMDKVKERGYKVKKTEDGYVISLKGMNWTTIDRAALRKLARGNMPDALSQKLQSKSDEPSATTTTTATGSSGGGGGGSAMPAVYEPGGNGADKQTQQENEREMTTAERAEGGGGGARGVATAGAILGALALLGQG